MREYKKIFMLLIIFSMFSIQYLIVNPTDTQTLDFTHEELAYFWAPLWYQDTDFEDYSADFITRFNFDGNWIGDDNWEHLYQYPLKAYIYYSVVETSTHWFIGYYDFHPRDWSVPIHENDLEGILIVIKKSEVLFGEFLCMVTEAHSGLYQYIDKDSEPSKSIRGNHETIDGDVEFGEVFFYEKELPFDPHYHPIVYVEAKGHGVYGERREDSIRWEDGAFPNGDGVIYSPKGIAEIPSNHNDRDVGYELLSINELWDRRFIFDNSFDGEKTFEKFGVLDGDDGDKAKTPWGWDDKDDGKTFAGEIFYNPADMINVHFKGFEDYNFTYTYNPYAIIISFNYYRINWETDLLSKVHGYFNLYMLDSERNYLHRLYKDGVLDIDSGTQLNWYGNLETRKWINLRDKIRRPFYGIRYPDAPYFGITSKDWDDELFDPKDDWLMDRKEIHWYGSENITSFNDMTVEYIPEGNNIHLNWTGSELYLSIIIEPEEYIELTFYEGELPPLIIRMNMWYPISFFFMLFFGLVLVLVAKVFKN